MTESPVWLVLAYDSTTGKSTEFHVIAPNTIEAMRLAFQSEKFSPERGYQINRVGTAIANGILDMPARG